MVAKRFKSHTRSVLSRNGGLPHGLAPSHHRVEGLVGGLRSPDHFQKLHDGHRVEEVEATAAVQSLRKNLSW